MKREWVVAACVLTGAAGLHVGKSAHAEPPQVKCETLYFAYEAGRKAGHENIDTQRNAIENVITAKMAAGYVRTIYSATLPVMSEADKTVAVGQTAVLCFATAGD